MSEDIKNSQTQLPVVGKKPEKKMGELTVLSRGRLCNKLRVLLTSVFAANQTDRNVNFGWVPNPGCKMRFLDFFEPIKGVKFFDDEKNMLDAILGSSAAVGRIDDVKQWDVGQNLLAVTCGTIKCGGMGGYNAIRSVRKQLKPMPEITAAVSKYADKNFKKMTVGIHIRALEHFLQITQIEKYCQVIAGIIPTGANIYLSTDSQSVADEIKKRFGDSILYRKKTLGSETIDGMKDAIIDLYLLNRCAKIWGTRTSSYNWMASIISNDVPLVVL